MTKEKIQKEEKNIGKLAGKIKQEFIELNLTKNDLDNLSEYLDSGNFRDYGYGHISLESGAELLIECGELIKNIEDYTRSLRKLGLESEEVIRHIENTNKRESRKESEKIIREERKLEDRTGYLKKQAEEAKKLAEERLNQLRYLQADFDNYRKKFDKEKEQIIRLANESLVKELIAILDDFDASSRALENEKNREGLEMLQKKFFQILEKHGLNKIEALGKQFDPNFHEVLCKQLSNHNEDEVIEEIQRGYTLQSKVIRPTKVKISKKKEKQNLKT